MRAWLEKTNNHTAEYLRMQAEYEQAKAEWDKAHPNGVHCFAEIPPFPPSRVSYNKYGISLHVYGESGSYDIWPWNRVDTKDAILWWVLELGGKLWCDARLIKDFVELTMAYVNGTLSFGKEVQS